MTDTAGLHMAAEVFQNAQETLIVGVVIGIVMETETGIAAVGPVELVEVDIVGLQAIQRTFHGGVDVLTRMARAVTNPGHGICASGDLGGQNDVLAIAARLEPFADDPLGCALGFRPWRNGIGLRRIEEIDTARQSIIHLRPGIGLTYLATKHHGAETDARNLKVSASQRGVFHVNSA